MSQSAVRPPSRAQLLARARDLLARGNWDDMGHSEYDAAWMARVPKPGTREPAFPEFVQEVRRSQAADGGWAPVVDYMSARILATLSCILAVVEFDSSPEARQQAEQGVEFIRGNWARLKQEPDLTIGFELVAASLIEECCKRGFKLEELRAETAALRDEKLSKVPPQLMYSPTFNLGYTIEFLGDKVDAQKAVALLASNGSMSGSVGSTAFFARQTGNEIAFRFCEEMAKTWGPQRTPCNMPSQLWTAIWLMYHFELAGLFPELRTELKPHLDFVARQVGKHGLGWSTEVLYGDSDDTAVGLMLLHDSGYTVDWSLLNQYERPHGFVGFLAERGPSVSANAHVLEAIVGRPHPGGEATVNKVARFLLDRRVQGAYWTDKWHASPYYATSHTLLPLLRWDAASVQPSARWLQETQREDGGWGWFGKSSAEETAYALYALAVCHTQGLPVDPNCLSRGLGFLQAYDGTESDTLHPHLWIGKGLYRPLLVIRAAVIAAQLLASKALGLKDESEGPTQLTA